MIHKIFHRILLLSGACLGWTLSATEVTEPKNKNNPTDMSDKSPNSKAESRNKNLKNTPKHQAIQFDAKFKESFDGLLKKTRGFFIKPGMPFKNLKQEKWDTLLNPNAPDTILPLNLNLKFGAKTDQFDPNMQNFFGNAYATAGFEVHIDLFDTVGLIIDQFIRSGKSSFRISRSMMSHQYLNLKQKKEEASILCHIVQSVFQYFICKESIKALNKAIDTTISSIQYAKAKSYSEADTSKIDLPEQYAQLKKNRSTIMNLNQMMSRIKQHLATSVPGKDVDQFLSECMPVCSNILTYIQKGTDFSQPYLGNTSNDNSYNVKMSRIKHRKDWCTLGKNFLTADFSSEQGAFVGLSADLSKIISFFRFPGRVKGKVPLQATIFALERETHQKLEYMYKHLEEMRNLKFQSEVDMRTGLHKENILKSGNSEFRLTFIDVNRYKVTSLERYQQSLQSLSIAFNVFTELVSYYDIIEKLVNAEKKSAKQIKKTNIKPKKSKIKQKIDDFVEFLDDEVGSGPDQNENDEEIRNFQNYVETATNQKQEVSPGIKSVLEGIKNRIAEKKQINQK